MKLSRYSKQFIKLRFIKYTALDISISFLAFRYPKKLIKHLRDERNLEVEKSSPGIYYINKETFKTQIIVISELSPEKYLYKIFKPIDYCQSQNEENYLWYVRDYLTYLVHLPKKLLPALRRNLMITICLSLTNCLLRIIT